MFSRRCARRMNTYGCDLDGNATLARASTRTWRISCNGENHPSRFENAETQTVVECAYDCHGRRCAKKVSVAGTATRPLTFRHAEKGLMLFYAFDGNKNVSDVFFFALQNGIGAHYEYAPFGAVTRTSKATGSKVDLIEANPWRFSSEFYDSELDLVYYNYRHYSPALGRWLSRDPIQEQGGLNLYAFVLNMPIFNIDIRGNIPDGWYVPERKLPEIPPLAYLLPWQIIPILPTGDGDWLTPVFDQRMPGTVNHMRQSFSDIIGRKIGENCGKPGSEAVHPIAPKATTIENVENYGDKPAEFWESAFALGKFSFDVENTTITYSPLECGKLRYEWTADMYVLDVLGLWNWPLARLAHWVISGSGECCPLKDS